MDISKIAVKKPATVLIIFIILAALGIYSTFSIPIDLFPDMELPYVAVFTTYENAGPEEVENSVTRLMETAVSGVTGIKELVSTSSQGTSVVYLELNYGTDIDSACNEMRDRIDMYKSYLPDDADSPLIMKLDPSMMPILNLVLTGNRTPEELRKIAEDTVQPRFEQVDGIAAANISGGREKAIIVDLPRDRLEAYNLTVTGVAQMLGAQNIQLSGGVVGEGDLNFTISTSGLYQSVEDIKNTVISYKAAAAESVFQAPSVKTVLLRDIADVYEGYKTQTSTAYVNGRPGVMISIQKQSGKNSVAAADAVKKQLENLQKELPDDIELDITYDTTKMIRNSINDIVNSVLLGASLAVIILFVFLRSIKSTIIVGLTIPVSLVITLGVMYFAGQTLNIMTLAGLSLGVGMLVDNAIVVLENIYSYRERGTKAEVAAVLGTKEMIMAITSSTLTTICVFLPLIMYKSKLGMAGQIFEGLTFTVVTSLLCSLIVAITLVPVLSSKYLKIENLKEKQYFGFRRRINDALESFFNRIDTAYGHGIKFVLNHKAATILVILTLFIGSLAMIPGIGFVYMPSQESDSVRLSVTMPQGTKLEVTETVLMQMEAIARAEVNGIKHTTVSVGSSGMMGGGSSTNSGTLTIALPEYEERIDHDKTVKEKLRAHFGDFAGADFSFDDSNSGIGGSGVDIVIKSDNLSLARATALDIQNVMKTQLTDYVTEPEIDLKDGLPQVSIIIDRPRMYNLGLTIYSVSSEIKANINGTTATRYQDNGTEIDVIVQLAEDDRQKLTDLEQIFVTNSSGTRIPLSSFARYAEGTSPVSINRENQTRVVHVTAKGKEGLSLDVVQKKVEEAIRASVPLEEGVILEYSGDFQTLMENFIQLAIIVLMAVLLVFAVMASQFESFLDPFIVLFNIPLSVIGIVIIYKLMGTPLNLITAVGLLVLVGVIINNGIVLIDYINLLRKRGMELKEACIEAGKSRLRPVLMSTLTTVLGLVPMTFMGGEGSAMSQPIGQTVFGGLSFGTLMTLFLMPVLYYLFHRARAKMRVRRERRRELRMEKIAARTLQESEGLK